MSDDIAAIAAGLSEKQKAMLCRSRRKWSHMPHWCSGPANTKKALRDRGLAHGDFCYLTPLGLAVRQHLMEQSHGE